MRPLSALLAIGALLPMACGAHTLPSRPLPPAAGAKLRRLLPFPEASLTPRVELSVGLRRSANQEAELFRVSTDCAAQIVAVRRTLVGGAADAARYRTLGYLYRQAGLPLKSEAAFRRSAALDGAVLRRRPDDGAALAGYGRTLEASGQPAAAVAFLLAATRTAPRSTDVWLALGSVSSARAIPKAEATNHLMRQAAAAYDRAVLLAPADPAVWAERGGFRTWRLPQSQGRPVSSEGLSDYEQAATLSPGDPYAQAIVPSTEGAAFEMTHNLECISKREGRVKFVPAPEPEQAGG